MELTAALAGFVLVIILLAVFLLPDYICWKRRVRRLPRVKAHHIQVQEEELAKRIKNVILESDEEIVFKHSVNRQRKPASAKAPSEAASFVFHVLRHAL